MLSGCGAVWQRATLGWQGQTEKNDPVNCFCSFGNENREFLKQIYDLRTRRLIFGRDAQRSTITEFCSLLFALCIDKFRAFWSNIQNALFSSLLRRFLIGFTQFATQVCNPRLFVVVWYIIHIKHPTSQKSLICIFHQIPKIIPKITFTRIEIIDFMQ